MFQRQIQPDEGLYFLITVPGKIRMRKTETMMSVQNKRNCFIICKIMQESLLKFSPNIFFCKYFEDGRDKFAVFAPQWMSRKESL